MKRLIVIIAIVASLASMSAQSRKGVSILGDSYSTFQGFVTPDSNFLWYFTTPNPELTDVNAVTQTWWHRLIKDQGWRLCLNNSLSGSTICNTGYNGEDYSGRSFIARMKNLGSPDIIFIFGGTNDSWANAPIGEYVYDNWTPQQLYSVKPAIAYMLSTMVDYYPGTDIYFIINSELKPEINESITSLCERYGVTPIMLHDIDKKAGHPSIKGMEQIAEQVKQHLKQ